MDSVEKLVARRPELAGVAPSLRKLIASTVVALRSGGSFFVAGNGGSGADSDHICGELLKGFMQKRPLSEAAKNEFAGLFGAEGADVAGKLQGGLRAISLLSHPAFNTAFMNDVDAGLIYAQQLWALARPGDVFLGISTGGGSKNVKAALMAAKVIGVKSFLLTGNKHGVCEKYADEVIAVDESETYLIQELHLPLYHAFCAAVEAEMFPTEGEKC
ncbi:MAG: SIS domain-containing protein [Lentisphaeria bacterium]|nr:SIS domain-containing protein [Lentisphaeria bacterium]